MRVPVFLTQTPNPVADAAENAGRWFDALLGAPLRSLIAFVSGLVLLALIRWLITRTVRSAVRGGSKVRHTTRRLLLRTPVGGALLTADPLSAARRAQRAETMGSVLRSTATFVIGIVIVTVIANFNNWDLGPVLASAGVLGVALGFGAQTLVKDVLAGIFMLIEDQFGVGDVIDVGEVTGSVEAIGLRVTQIRDLSGTLWYVRNGEMLRVGNMTQGWSRARVEVLIPCDGDVDQATRALKDAAADIAADEELAPYLLADAEVTGYEGLSAESIMLRLMIKVAPAKQWIVQRALRAQIRERFASEHIPLALPRHEVVVERDRPGDDTGTPSPERQRRGIKST